MTTTQDTFVMSTSGEMMEVLDRFRLDQKVETVKEDPVQRQILRIILKYEMQTLLQRLAEIGEESVVVTANVLDGTHSVLASNQGERFLHNGVVSNFMDHFVRYLYTGETPGSVSDVAGSGDGYIVKYGINRQENNLSRSSFSSSDEPETFMHMKKHQIEQFNRRKDHEDRAIDETVSKLVRNILREGKEKERRNHGSPGASIAPMKRKRMFSSPSFDNQGSASTETCSVAKKKPIAEFFPTLSPMLSRNSSDNLSDSCHNYSEKNNSETPGDEVITIKIEPHDVEEYGGIVSDVSDKDKTDRGSEETNFIVINSSECSNQEQSSQTSELPEESIHSVKAKGSNEVIIEHSNDDDNSNDYCGQSSGSQTVSETKTKCRQTSETLKVKIEEDIDLPFVEEYYQNRGKCVQDVKLTPEEIGTDSPTLANVSCYKQSRKKSNTFNLVLNGYLYIKDKQGSTGTVYWKCGRVGCKGRVIQRGQELIISQTHIHGPSQNVSTVRQDQTHTPCKLLCSDSPSGKQLNISIKRDSAVD